MTSVSVQGAAKSDRVHVCGFVYSVQSATHVHVGFTEYTTNLMGVECMIVHVIVTMYIHVRIVELKIFTERITILVVCLNCSCAKHSMEWNCWPPSIQFTS